MDYKNSKLISKNTDLFLDKEKNKNLYKKDLENTDVMTNEKASKLETFILNRLSNMTAKKSSFKQDIDLSDLAYESKTDIIVKWSQFFNYPLEKSIIWILEAELWDRDIIYKIEPVWNITDVNKIKPNQIVMDFIYGEDKTSEKMKTFRKHFLKYWFSVVFEWLSIEKRKIRSKNEKFDWVFLKWSSDFEKDDFIMNLWSRVVHPNNFFIDDSVIRYNDANDCIEQEKLWKIDVLSKFNWKQFFNLSKMVDSLLETDNIIYHYYNIIEDIYAILVNNILIYEGPNPYPHKQLPYSVSIMQESDNSVYWEGWLVKLLRFAKPYLNEIFNITLKQSKNSNTPPIMLWNWVNFDWQEPSFNIWSVRKFSWSLNEVREMKVSPPDTSMFNLITIIQDLIVQLIWIDPRNLFSNSAKTKFEAWLIEQSKNKRISIFWKSLDYAYWNFLNQRIKNSHFFLSVLAIEEIIDINSIKKAWFKKILLKDQVSKKLDDWSLEFESVPWAYSEFELNPENIKWDYSIRVITESTKPILKEIAKDDILKVSGEVLNIINVMNANPNLSTTVNFEGLIKNIFETYWIDTQDLMMDTKSNRIADKIQKLKEEALKAINSIDQPQEQTQPPQ